MTFKWQLIVLTFIFYENALKVSMNNKLLHMNYRVFYSWQSDLPKEANQRAIGGCIKFAMVSLEENMEDVKITFDESTRGNSGSPDIPETIFSKISECDIFICDITTINSLCKCDSIRKVPNPNVLIELGYAIATLGWERIIMVFNQGFGSFSDDLPFDLNKRRVTHFKILDKSDKQGKNSLTSVLIEGISAIIDKDPQKPLDGRPIAKDVVKRDKDIHHLIRLMSCVHIETFDDFMSELPNRVIGHIFFFWNIFREVYESNTFHIYDKRLRELIDNLYTLWEKTLSYPHLFYRPIGSEDLSLDTPFDEFRSEKHAKDFDLLVDDLISLQKCFKELVVFVREDYLEVDINELSNEAYKLYLSKR